MQKADYKYHWPTPRMQECVSMNKSSTTFRHSCMNQAWSEEEEKERQKRQTKEAAGMKDSPTKQKPIAEEVIQGLYMHSSGCAVGGTHNFP